MIRTYKIDDKQSLLKIIQTHVPQYFDESEVADFSDYLDNKLEDYFVFEQNGIIIGSGGINYFKETSTARISWDMIHPDYMGQGIGKKLLSHRIEHIKKNPAIDQIVVRTSQIAFKFYQKSGFELVSIEKDFWAEGYDLYLMQLR